MGQQHKHHQNPCPNLIAPFKFWQELFIKERWKSASLCYPGNSFSTNTDVFKTAEELISTSLAMPLHLKHKVSNTTVLSCHTISHGIFPSFQPQFPPIWSTFFFQDNTKCCHRKRTGKAGRWNSGPRVLFADRPHRWWRTKVAVELHLPIFCESAMN